MATRLKNLKISEVSSVDRGAGEGVEILLMKRNESNFAKSAAILKDLSEMAGGAMTFEEAHAAVEAGEYAEDMLGEIQEAMQALLQSVTSIMGDDDCPDKQAKLGETFAQFKAHIATIAPEDLEKVLTKAAHAAIFGKASTMTPAEMKAMMDKMSDKHKSHMGKMKMSDAMKSKFMSMSPDERDSQMKTDMEKMGGDYEKMGDDDMKKSLDDLQKRLGDLELENAVLKMSADHRSYMDGAGMDDATKSAFVKMAPAARDAHIDANSIEKRLPAHIQKALADAAHDRETIRKLQESADVTAFAKRAVDLGLAEAQGEMLRKAHAGDKAALGEMERLLKGLVSQAATGKIFAEFGTAVGKTHVSAEGELVEKGEEIRKAQPSLTKEQAFAKAFEDPANRDLVNAYREEQRKARAA